MHRWVPYYVMHKLLAGLLVHAELFSSQRALRVATRLGEHLRWRAMRVMAGVRDAALE